MSTKPDGGPAFPAEQYTGEVEFVEGVGNCRVMEPTQGMTLRDYFAAKALQGILACFRDYEGAEGATSRVVMAYKYADAMLAERAK